MLTLNACPALLLNADFRPIGAFPFETLNWQDAVKSVLLERTTVVDTYDTVVRSPGAAGRAPFEMQLPSVLALKEYQRQDRPVAFTRIGVFVRDRFTCGYCAKRFPTRELTFDHLVPQSKGGKTSWLNIVSACSPCNELKGDKAPEAVGLTLRRKPFVPTRWQLSEAAMELPIGARRVHPTWRMWLGMSEAATVEEEARVTEDAGTGLAFPTDMTSDAYWQAELDEG